MSADELRTQTVRIAEEAGRTLRENFQSPALKVQPKQDYVGSIVTQIDKQSEDLVIGSIRALGESSLVVSEESCETRLGVEKGLVWYVDPLDGTQNYVRGIPHFCVSIAVEREGRIVLGVVHNPVTRQTWVAEKGKGAFLNGKSVVVSKNVLKHSAVIFEWWEPDRNIRDPGKLLSALLRNTLNIRHLGSVALNLALLGSGSYDGLVTVYAETPRYEIAAGALIAEEAGATITNSDRESWASYRNSIIAGNPDIHAELLQLVKTAR